MDATPDESLCNSCGWPTVLHPSGGYCPTDRPRSGCCTLRGGYTLHFSGGGKLKQPHTEKPTEVSVKKAENRLYTVGEAVLLIIAGCAQTLVSSCDHFENAHANTSFSRHFDKTRRDVSRTSNVFRYDA